MAKYQGDVPGGDVPGVMFRVETYPEVTCLEAKCRVAHPRQYRHTKPAPPSGQAAHHSRLLRTARLVHPGLAA